MAEVKTVESIRASICWCGACPTIRENERVLMAEIDRLNAEYSHPAVVRGPYPVATGKPCKNVCTGEAAGEDPVDKCLRVVRELIAADLQEGEEGYNSVRVRTEGALKDMQVFVRTECLRLRCCWGRDACVCGAA